jgi:hypothetical protein
MLPQVFVKHPFVTQVQGTGGFKAIQTIRTACYHLPFNQGCYLGHPLATVMLTVPRQRGRPDAAWCGHLVGTADIRQGIPPRSVC